MLKSLSPLSSLYCLHISILSCRHTHTLSLFLFLFIEPPLFRPLPLSSTIFTTKINLSLYLFFILTQHTYTLFPSTLLYSPSHSTLIYSTVLYSIVLYLCTTSTLPLYDNHYDSNISSLSFFHFFHYFCFQSTNVCWPPKIRISERKQTIDFNFYL